MKQQDLINMGFKKESLDSDYWYQLKAKNHIFFTNDTIFNKGKDEWIIGYKNIATQEEFWFNQNLYDVVAFRIIFRVLIGKEFKLSHQRKLIK